MPERASSRLRRLVGPLADPMVLLLLVAAVTYLLIGDTADAIVAFVALGPVAAVGWLLEARAQRTLDRLEQLTAPTAVTWRDGQHAVVPALDLVVGDLLWLREGDVVPADAAVVDTTELTVDEAALTGESVPVGKAPPGPGRDAKLWAGTVVLSGRAAAQITATGSRTRYGQIASLVSRLSTPRTPLQRALARLVITLGVLAVLFCGGVVAAILARGGGWGDAVIAGVSLGIAAIPEEFSVVYALYLALGAWRLAHHQAVVRDLPGVETLGSTTVICTDKTGTLTEGRLSVAATAPVGGTSAVAADRALMEAAVLACEPQPYDPLDVAIVDEARRRGVDVERLQGGELVVDWPFDQEEKYLSHVWRLPDGTHRVVAKGSIEGILGHTPVPQPQRREAFARHDAFADQGMRVVAVAAAPVHAPSGTRAGDEGALAYVGLVAFSDPVREGVAEALAECRRAGIRVVLVTGDHPATAHAVAEGLLLPHERAGRDLVSTGDDLDHASGEEIDELARTTNVFARTRPEQKHLLVEALRQQGEVVAVTGDGVNDAPALRAADIGVAMGRRGTAVAREAATIVLLDDNFATIVSAIRGGRRIYDNLTRAFGYLIAFHPPLLIAALVVPLVGEPLLLLPVHLVVLELLLHPIVSLVFQADPAARDVMDRPPRSTASGLGLRAFGRPYAVGLTLAAAVLALYLLSLEAGWPVEEARALAFVTLLVAQPLLLVVERSPESPVWRTGIQPTRTLLWAVTAILATLLAAVYFPALASVLSLAPFPPAAWMVVLAAATASTLWSEFVKDLPHRSEGTFGPALDPAVGRESGDKSHQ